MKEHKTALREKQNRAMSQFRGRSKKKGGNIENNVEDLLSIKVRKTYTTTHKHTHTYTQLNTDGICLYTSETLKKNKQTNHLKNY